MAAAGLDAYRQVRGVRADGGEFPIGLRVARASRTVRDAANWVQYRHPAGLAMSAVWPMAMPARGVDTPRVWLESSGEVEATSGEGWRRTCSDHNTRGLPVRRIL
jgi:hypothetical protein